MPPEIGFIPISSAKKLKSLRNSPLISFRAQTVLGFSLLFAEDLLSVEIKDVPASHLYCIIVPMRRFLLDVENIMYITGNTLIVSK